MVREFKLKNEKGQEYSLMDIERYCLLTEPSGLGYSYSTEYEQLGNSFFTNLRKLEQGIITGVANFLNYENFMNFGNFVESTKKLQFVYSIPYEGKKKTFYRDINIKSIGKSEKQKDGVLSETVEFECLSLWYEQNETTFKIEPQANEMRWNFKWDTIFNDNSSQSINYENKGQTDAPIFFEINGPTSNLILQIYENSELVQEVKVKANILKYEKLIYSSKENEFAIKKIKTDGTEESLFDLDIIDFENNNVIRIPKDAICELRIKADNVIENAKLTIYPQYKCV